MSLDILGQGGGEAVEVHFVGVLALGLDKDLVPLALGKAHDLVLDRGAVARPLALDEAAKERRAVETRADYLVGFLVCVGHPAGEAGPVDPVVNKGEGSQALALLPLHGVEIYRTGLYPCGGARLEPAKPEAPAPQGVAQAHCGPLAQPAPRGAPLPDKEPPFHKSARRQDKDMAADPRAALGDDALDPATPSVDHEVDDGVHKDFEATLSFEGPAREGGVEGLVCLGPRCLDCGPPRAVEHPVLDH